jgi:PRTRC genetic system protein B
MKNISNFLSNVYVPSKAILLYNNFSKTENEIYVESFDIDRNGKPINAHPLSEQESIALSKALHHSVEKENNFLQCKEIIPDNVLFINTAYNGFVIWFTREQKVNLFFKEELGIPSGKAKVPALIWKASKDHLEIFAVLENKRPKENTQLFFAPFLNVFKTGKVCMGTVDINIENKCCLEDFIKYWEEYFWNSWFSHGVDNYNPVSTNIVQLWNEQVNTNRNFPKEVLLKNNGTLKDLYHETGY